MTIDLEYFAVAIFIYCTLRMGKAAIEVAALVVLLIGSILTCIAVFLPYWAKNAPRDTTRNDIIMVSDYVGKLGWD